MTTDTHELERASAPGRALAQAVADGKVNAHAILQAMGINSADPLFQAMLLVCERYELDPMLGHVEVLPRTKKPYITRDGFLHIAHRSGQLDGYEVVEESETNTHWVAKVAVYRKDMGRPFTFTGRYPKAGSNKQYGPEMAIKTAERTALKRAFNVAEPTDDDHRQHTDTSALTAEVIEHVAVREWVAEHGDPAELESGDEAEVIDDTPALDLDGGDAA